MNFFKLVSLFIRRQSHDLHLFILHRVWLGKKVPPSRAASKLKAYPFGSGRYSILMSGRTGEAARTRAWRGHVAWFSVVDAYFARVGRRFRAILGTRFRPSWAAISRTRAGWPTVSWSQAWSVWSRGFVTLALRRKLSPERRRRWALWTSLSRMASARVGSPMASCQ
jgi:hypothetical protein